MWKCRKSNVFDLRDAWRLQGVQEGCSRFWLVPVNRAIVGVLLLSGLEVEPEPRCKLGAPSAIGQDVDPHRLGEWATRCQGRAAAQGSRAGWVPVGGAPGSRVIEPVLRREGGRPVAAISLGVFPRGGLG